MTCSLDMVASTSMPTRFSAPVRPCSAAMTILVALAKSILRARAISSAMLKSLIAVWALPVAVVILAMESAASSSSNPNCNAFLLAASN
jgi:hypothetical protein